MCEKGTDMIRIGLLLVALLVGVLTSPGWAAPPEAPGFSGAVQARSAEPADASNGERRCFGKRPTIVGTRGADQIRGTKREDIIWARAGDDVSRGCVGKTSCAPAPATTLFETSAVGP
jgi:hypothetical protein